MEKFLVSRFSIYENEHHWSREPIKTLSGPSMFMFSIILYSLQSLHSLVGSSFADA